MIKKLCFFMLTFIGLSVSAQNTWIQKPTFSGLVRSEAVGFSINGKGYIGTGSDGSNYYDDFWEYDTTNGVWTQLADVTGGSGRIGAIGFAIGNKGYIGTGTTGGNNNSKDDFYEYDPSSNNWTAKTNLPGANAKRRFAFSFSIAGKGYVGGGDGITIDPNDMLEYNPNSNLWTIVASNVGATGDIFAATFSIGTKAYIGVGNNSLFYEWDQGTGAWTQKASYPGNGIYYLFGFSIGNLGYMGGGRDVSAEVQDFWQYNPLSNQWIQKANFGGGPRAQAVGFAIGNKGYAGTGFNGNINTQDFWQYIPDTLVITGEGHPVPPILKLFPNPSTGRFSIDSKLIDGEIYVYNLIGKNVMHSKISQSIDSIIDLSDQPDGIYILTIKTEGGSLTQKVIITH